MPFSTLALLVLAGALHAGWNLVLKRTEARLVVAWASLVMGALVSLPAFFLFPPLPARAVACAALSALLEGLYFTLLTRAYGRGDFSVVYPVARGAAPALLALWAVAFLGERPTPLGWLGLGVLIAGLVWVGRSGTGGSGTGVSAASVGLALAVSVTISLYSAVDAVAVRQAHPIPYTALVFLLSAGTIGAALLLGPDRAQLGKTFARSWRPAALVGVLSLATYVMVLAAYSRGSVAYAGAVREVSIVFGALAGWLWLKESFGPARLAGSLLIFLGALLIAFGG